MEMDRSETTSTCYFESPLGWIRVTASQEGLKCVEFCEEVPEVRDCDDPIVNETIRQLREYFSGTRTVFSIPIDPEGTDFRKRVWTELLKIPFGKTISYLELAHLLGDEKVIRAAASANGSNPIAIIVPCHRVIGADGSLTGYAGGLHRKQWLLEHESGFKQTALFD